MLKIIMLVILGIIVSLILLYKILYRDLTTVMYEGLYKDKKVKVEAILHRGLIMNSSTHKIKLGNLPAINVNWSTTDLRSVPYSDDVFGNADRLYIDTTLAYQQEIVFDDSINASILYLDKKEFSKTDFEMYKDFFKNEWQNVISEMKKKDYQLINYIIGIVHGAKNEFILTFRGSQDGQKYKLEIRADGELVYQNDLPSGGGGITGPGLSSKVQMPGKILYYRPDAYNPVERFKEFKDKNGKTIFDYFTVIKEKE
jgi:rRNA processing protein Gar1